MSFLSSLLRRSAAVLAAGALLAAAGSARAQGDAPVQPNAQRTTPYRIITNDRLGIHIFQEDDLSLTARVDARGNIPLNLVGQVHVFGQTLTEAEHTVEQAYKDGRILRHPEVTITVEEYAPREVSVNGQVKNPNRYPLPLETATTLSEIISRAGGFTDTAKGTAVRVTRMLLDGSTRIFEVDVEDVMKGKEKDHDKVQAANMLLEPGDIIYVPERII